MEYSVRDKLWTIGVEGVKVPLSSFISDISESGSLQGVIPQRAGLSEEDKCSIYLFC